MKGRTGIIIYFTGPQCYHSFCFEMVYKSILLFNLLSFFIHTSACDKRENDFDWFNIKEFEMKKSYDI